MNEEEINNKIAEIKKKFNERLTVDKVDDPFGCYINRIILGAVMSVTWFCLFGVVILLGSTIILIFDGSITGSKILHYKLMKYRNRKL